MGSAAHMEKKWLLPAVMFSLLLIFVLATFLKMGGIATLHTFDSNLALLSHLSSNKTTKVVTDGKVEPPPPIHSDPMIPLFAYLISGSKGDLEKLWRTLKAVYHPLNQYVVHLDLESPADERLELASRVANESIFAKVGNVFMITNANMVTYRGPTMVSNTLHACAILLKRSRDWDWFINLSASDYPLVTQDDLLSTFSTLNRKLNFIEHTSHLGWKEDKRAMPMVVDPGLYTSTKSDIFWVLPKRSLPTAFKLFTGSAWMILSHEFVEYIIWGWDNLPRTLLMYYTNFVSSPEGYFHTVICNLPGFVKTLVNHDLHYIAWDVPPRQHPHTLSLGDYTKMFASGAAFARKFKQDDPVLDKIDKDLLHRKEDGFTPGGWCGGHPKCSEVRNPMKLKPGLGAQRLGLLITNLTLTSKDGKNQCST